MKYFVKLKLGNSFYFRSHPFRFWNHGKSPIGLPLNNKPGIWSSFMRKPEVINSFSLGILWFTPRPCNSHNSLLCLKAAFQCSSSTPMKNWVGGGAAQELLPTWACTWPLDPPSALSRSVWDEVAFSRPHFMSLYNSSHQLCSRQSPAPENQNFLPLIFTLESFVFYVSFIYSFKVAVN